MSSEYPPCPVSLRAIFRPTRPDAPRLCGSFAAGPSSALREDLLRNGRLPEAAAAFLAAMDAKLDRLLERMQRSDLEEDFPCRGRVVSLGSAEAVLECREPLAPGDHLELVLLLGERGLDVASCVARVTAPGEESARSGPDRSVWRLAFSRVREEDREALIRFLFQEERRRIREWKADD